MVTNDFGQVVKGPVILPGGGVTVPCLHQAHKVLRIVHPPASILAVVLHIRLKVVLLAQCTGHEQVARQHIVECRNIGGSLEDRKSTRLNSSHTVISYAV